MISLKSQQNISRLALVGAMLLFFLLVTFTLSALPALAQDEDDEPVFSADVVTATTTVNLNLRAGPGVTHTVLAVLEQGSVVGFTGFMDESGDWVQVDAADGPTGWVAGRFLSFVPDELQIAPEMAEEAVQEEEAAAEEEAADEEPVFSPAVVTATTTVNLNLRDAPGITATTVLTTLPQGSVVGFTGFMDASGDWVQVDAADGPTGWVAARFLSNVPEDLQVAPAEDEGEEADDDDEAATDDAEAAAEDEGAADEAAAEDEADAGEPVFSSAVVTATTTGNLNLRAGPGTEFEILATLEEGTVVGFTGFMDGSGDWAQVDAADGPTGWVAVNWLSYVPSELQVAEEFADTDEGA